MPFAIVFSVVGLYELWRYRKADVPYTRAASWVASSILLVYFIVRYIAHSAVAGLLVVPTALVVHQILRYIALRHGEHEITRGTVDRNAVADSKKFRPLELWAVALVGVIAGMTAFRGLITVLLLPDGSGNSLAWITFIGGACTFAALYLWVRLVVLKRPDPVS